MIKNWVGEHKVGKDKVGDNRLERMMKRLQRAPSLGQVFFLEVLVFADLMY